MLNYFTYFFQWNFLLTISNEEHVFRLESCYIDFFIPPRSVEIDIQPCGIVGSDEISASCAALQHNQTNRLGHHLEIFRRKI